MVLEGVRDRTRLTHVVTRAKKLPLTGPRTLFWSLAALAGVACIIASSLSRYASHALFIPMLVAAGLFLQGRRLLASLAITLGAYATTFVLTWQRSGTHWSIAGVMAAVLLLVAAVARRRRPSGVSLSVSSGMVADLRNRLDRQAQIPPLPSNIHLEACVMPAQGSSFSGDFVVAARKGSVVDVALTDVSGHGPYAATRALLLSGALSGLLGETDPKDFLPAANRYLIRQGWRDGFASAIHLALDVETGEFGLGAAGHPSAAHFHAATRRWEMVNDAAGLLLGLFEQGSEDYLRSLGTLEPGDVLLLYTDGVVEGPTGDITAGTKCMLETAQKAMASGMTGAARRICQASARRGGTDDRSAVVMWRDPEPVNTDIPIAPPAASVPADPASTNPATV